MATTHREFLAVVWPVTLLRPYLKGIRFTIRTDHEALRWILTMAEAMGKLARLRLRLSEFEFDILHRAGIKHQAAEALSRLKTKGEDKSSLYDKVPVLTSSQKPFACVPRTETTDFELIGEPKGTFVPFIPDVCTVAGITDSEKAEVPTLAEFISAQATDADYRAAFASVGRPNTRFDVDGDGVSVRVSRLDGDSERFLPTTLRTRFLHLCHYTLLAGHPGERRMYDSMRNDLYWPRMANDVYATVRDCRCSAQNRMHGKRQRQLNLFFPEGPLEYAGMDIL